MKNIFQYLQGDKGIWGIIMALSVFSFLPVYSASSNLAYLYGDGSTLPYLLKHFAHLILGFGILYGIHKIPYQYFRGLSILALPIVVVLLIFTIAEGTTIGGANASRWLRLPFVGITFQTSIFAGVVLMAYVAFYLARNKEKQNSFKATIAPLWLPVFVVLALILPANFSTAAIFFSMIVMLVFIGGYPLKYLGIILGAGLLFLSVFVLAAKAFPGVFPNRVDTWISRVENFKDKTDTEADYQIEKAKIAIASGGITGVGPGKSKQKNFLPQSSSDFIYAIIVEEFGLMGGLAIIGIYMFLLFRIVVIANKAASNYGKLLVIGVGIPIVFMAMINMAVAVELFPVTGQNLPLISSGGTSVWMTCMAMGMVLSVSVKREVEPNIDMENIEEGEEVNPLDILSETI